VRTLNFTLIALVSLLPNSWGALAETLGDARVGFSAERVLIFDGQSYVGRMWHMPGEQRHEQDLPALRPIFILRADSAIGDIILPKLHTVVEFALPKELSILGDPGLLPRLAGDRGPLLADVTAQQAPAGTQAPRHRQSRIAGERADLHHAGRSHGPDQHLHQQRLVVADLHARGATGLLLRDALQLELVSIGRGGMRRCVVCDHRVDELAARASGRWGHFRPFPSRLPRG